MLEPPRKKSSSPDIDVLSREVMETFLPDKVDLGRFVAVEFLLRTTPLGNCGNERTETRDDGRLVCPYAS